MQTGILDVLNDSNFYLGKMIIAVWKTMNQNIHYLSK